MLNEGTDKRVDIKINRTQFEIWEASQVKYEADPCARGAVRNQKGRLLQIGGWQF